jgi:hypothetical protein
MAKKLNVEEVLKLKETISKKGDVKFGAEISALKKGEGFVIKLEEWDLKTTIPAYYYGKFRKGVSDKDREYSYRKIGDSYLIEKIK